MFRKENYDFLKVDEWDQKMKKLDVVRKTRRVLGNIDKSNEQVVLNI